MSSDANSILSHIPVLEGALISGLVIRPGAYYLDATVGGGGHTLALFHVEPDLKVWAIDRDETALELAKTRLFAYKDRLHFWYGNFAEFEPGEVQFDGIIADLGVNSMQFDQPDRGFSFRHTARLDMRMDQQQSLTAEEIINGWDETKLAEIFYTYGEERLSRRIAKQIVAQRPFETTLELADTIARCVPAKYRYGRIHPATRVFQALRIVVNQELSALELFLRRSPTWLKPGGRIGVISFHSLEDRRVKHAFKASEQLQVLTKKPIVATEQEIQQNSRSRSAKLRIAEKRDEL